MSRNHFLHNNIPQPSTSCMHGITVHCNSCMVQLYYIISYRFSEASSATRTWLDNLACSGYESRLIDCPANTIGVEDCVHYEDIALICTESTASKNILECTKIYAFSIL